VRDGKAFNIERHEFPIADFNCLCQRGYTNLERVYAAERIQYPLRRVGERGSGEWERISWDEAISEICTKWKGYQSEFGNESIAFAVGAFETIAADIQYVLRLMTYMGVTKIANSFDLNLLRTIPKLVGMGAAALYFSDVRDMANSRNVIIWGANPTEAGNTHYHFISDAVERGARLIVVDPVFTLTAAKADKFIPIRPGSDGLLAFGMMQVLLRDGLEDLSFLKAQSVAPFLVKDSDGLYLRLSDLGRAVAGSPEDAIMVMDANGNIGTAAEIVDPVIEGDGTFEGIKVTTAYSLLLDRVYEWSLDKIVELTTVPLETIEELARIYVEGPSCIMVGYGPDHYTNGHAYYHAVYALAMLAGQIAKPGAGFTCVQALYKPQGTSTAALTTPAGQKPNFTLYVPQVYDLVTKGKYGDKSVNVKSMYVYGLNALGNLPDRKSWLEIFAKVEFVVVADIWMGEMAKGADIVLPVSHYFEYDGLANIGSPYLVVSEQALSPAFESKDDIEIANLIGKGMGLPEEFFMSRQEYLEALFDNDVAKSRDITWRRLKQEKHIWAITDSIVSVGYGDFGTATKRAQFYIENNQPVADYGQPWDIKYESLPYWEPPAEAWFESEKAKQYPLHFTTERAKFKQHTMFSKTPMLLEIEPEPYVTISVEDAKSRGIVTGDIVRVFNDRGHVVVKAHVNAGNRPGVLVIDHGWEGDQFIDGHYSDLSSRVCHAAVPNTCFFECLCEVEKVG
jgi:molybdopterin-containing oxidoreductase family molybdopterin binding subunit